MPTDGQEKPTLDLGRDVALHLLPPLYERRLETLSASSAATLQDREILHTSVQILSAAVWYQDMNQ